ncbi:MAG: T9SS type B sorting domain-containing protein, partial [Lutibacter sp.]|uniref:T9SS type B sorting domain-containing protein n=1 Tax=Lutibacter sp. TaxID=1925666 RepID=UPI0017BD6C55
NEIFYPNSNIYIFDRFGKLITQINPEGNGWNGIFNGQQLPATDYWFSVELIDLNGKIRTKKGNFSLIRR